MPVIESLLRLAEVARLCRVDEATITRMIESEQTPAPIRLNGELRFRASEIDEWIRSGCPNRNSFEERQSGGSG